jgi:hypothetical protein
MLGLREAVEVQLLFSSSHLEANVLHDNLPPRLSDLNLVSTHQSGLNLA